MSVKEIGRPQLELWIEITDTYGNTPGWLQLRKDQFWLPKSGTFRYGPELLP